MTRLGAVALLLLTACSNGVARPAPDLLPLPHPTLTAPRPDGVTRTRPVEWEAVEYVDPWTLDVHYVAGVEPCFNLAEVHVVETGDVVRVTLLEGTPPLPDGTACPALGISARTRVRLGKLLGERRLVDGAAPGDVRRVRAR